jgi:hypothetical protein
MALHCSRLKSYGSYSKGNEIQIASFSFRSENGAMPEIGLTAAAATAFRVTALGNILYIWALSVA